MATEALMAATVFDYDEQVPPWLIARWNRIDQDRAVLLDLGLLLLCVVAVVAAAVGLGGLFFGVPAAASSGLVAAAVAVLVLAKIARRLLVRGAVLLPARELDLILAHQVEICFSTTDSASEEAGLAARAGSIGAGIVASPAWCSGVMGDHPEQLDPIEEARQIQVAAWRLRRVRGQLGEQPEGDDPLAEHTAAEWRHLTRQAQATLTSLRDRVDALDRYRADLVTLSDTLARAQRLTDLRTIADEHGALMALDMATHELAAERVNTLDVQAALRQAELRADGDPPSPDRPL